MSDKTQLLQAPIESLLFLHGDPLPLKKIAKMLNADETHVRIAIKNLQTYHAHSKSSLRVILAENSAQIGIKPEYSSILESVIKQELNEELTPAALETMAIIAYAGPISRTLIDYVRGVNSSYTLRNLMIRGLVSREIDPNRQQTFLYSPTIDFVRHMGFGIISELPEYEKFRDLINRIKPIS